MKTVIKTRKGKIKSRLKELIRAAFIDPLLLRKPVQKQVAKIMAVLILEGAVVISGGRYYLSPQAKENFNGLQPDEYLERLYIKTTSK